MTSDIFVRLAVVGFHYWPGAPHKRGYLAARHRHLFGVEVRVPANVDNERAIEFHDLLDFLHRQLHEPCEFGPASCETIAARIGEDVADFWPVEWVEVTVTEDDECGAKVTLGPSDLRSSVATPTAAAVES